LSDILRRAGAGGGGGSGGGGGEDSSAPASDALGGSPLRDVFPPCFIVMELVILVASESTLSIPALEENVAGAD
jgi:hypothetical protein